MPHPQVAKKPLDDKPIARIPEDKLSVLRSYRRARGLCERCVEKWVHGHKCAATIQLHAIQEMRELFNVEEPEDSPEAPTEQLLLALSHDARMVSHGHRTIRFHGTIAGQPIVVLVDSGSSASFLAASVADLFPQLPRSPISASVKIANGELLRCTVVIPGC